MSLTEAAFIKYQPFMISKRPVPHQEANHKQPTWFIHKMKQPSSLPSSTEYFHSAKLTRPFFIPLENC